MIRSPSNPSGTFRTLTGGALAGLLLAACTPVDLPVDGAPRGAAVDGAEVAAAAPEPMAEPSIAEERPAVPEGRSRAYAGRPRAGVVTAGDIDDTLNLGAFQRYLSRAGRETGLPHADFGAPVLARLVGPDGRPAPGVQVTLRIPGAAEPFWQGYSGVDGNLTVFPGTHGAGRPGAVELRAFAEAQEGPDFSGVVRTGGAREEIRLPFDGGWQPDFLDLAFVVDTTGSMGDEIAWLTRELRGIVAAARRAAPGVDIRYGLVAYRDEGDDYVVRSYGFTGSIQQMQGWLRGLEAAGGGDYPEAAAAALRAGAGLDWRRGRGERLLFHVADAPPHRQDAGAYLDAARLAARRGVQVFGLGASGVAAESEYLMRQAAAQTEGRYLFLTDDSGVGLAHAEPTVACYRVTQLRALLVRVLGSELGGRRLEAPSDEVVREVGTYRGGVCRT